MAQTTTNVSASKPPIGGAIYVADPSVTLPTSATATLATGFTSLGYISDDGITNNNSPEADVIKAWGGDSVLTITNDKEDAFGFKLIEILNPDVLKLVYGDDNVTGALATGITVKANNNDMPAKSYVIDMVLRNNALKRIVIPKAYVTSVGEISYADSDAVGYDVSISAQADTSGNTHYEYIAAAATTSSSSQSNG